MLALLLPVLPVQAEDEPFESPTPAPTPSAASTKNASEDIDLFLKGLNEATDADAQLAAAGTNLADDGAAPQKKAKAKKNKRSKRKKGGVS